MTVSTPDHEWTVDLTKLPLTSDDCPACAADADAQSCMLNCPIGSPYIAGYSKSPPLLFFTVITTNMSQNVPHILYEADLTHGTIVRVSTEASGIGDLFVSPSGRYVAYAAYFSMGVCYVSSSIRVADLKGVGNSGNAIPVVDVGQPSGSVLAKPLRWKNADTLVYEKATYPHERTCGPHRQQTQIVNVRGLRFPN